MHADEKLSAFVELGSAMREPTHIDIAGFVERLHALNRSESGIGRFSPELRLVFRPAVTKGQPAGEEESP